MHRGRDRRRAAWRQTGGGHLLRPHRRKGCHRKRCGRIPAFMCSIANRPGPSVSSPRTRSGLAGSFAAPALPSSHSAKARGSTEFRSTGPVKLALSSVKSMRPPACTRVNPGARNSKPVKSRRLGRFQGHRADLAARHRPVSARRFRSRVGSGSAAAWHRMRSRAARLLRHAA